VSNGIVNTPTHLLHPPHPLPPTQPLYAVLVILQVVFKISLKTGWTWLVLRDTLKIACNIMSTAYKGCMGGWEGVERVKGVDGLVGGWVNNAIRHRRPSFVHSTVMIAIALLYF